ncbi:FUSC family protein [Microbacterium timonense]|uniref:FUSC family protein n=1 Tax=Microbacterium timonense TaxID=2086576 RepID=UPI000D0E369F|nr:FUSC family protein [Microbacterium timonense]
MDVVWVVVGVLLLLVTLLDAFLAVLNYDEAGLVVDRIIRAQWLLLRAVTRRVGRRWRPLVLRQVTGILIVVTILWWVAGIVFGFAFIYLGALGMSGALVTSTGVQPDFLGAFYLSLGQFSTVGVDNIGPAAAVLNIVTVAEAMMSVVMLSFIITFLSSVYGVIQSLQSLSANFFRAGRGITDPIDSLAPFFPGGASRGLDGQLGSILDALNAYGHGLAQNRAAYYFQSGRDQFALPFSLYMTAGVIGALRWGLPTGSDPSREPALLRLTDAFEDFRVRLERALRWPPGVVPTPVTAQEFAAAVDAYQAPGPTQGVDSWVVRFLTIDRRMAALTRSDARIDRDDAYRRYTEWLPFEVPTQVVLAAVSRDLDYQPIYRRIASTPEGLPVDGPDDGYELLPVDESLTVQATTLASAAPRPRVPWLRRQSLVIDPGGVRLASAGRTIAGVLVAIGVVGGLALATGGRVVDGAVLAGLIALFASPAAIGAPAGVHRWVGLIAVVPTAFGVALGSVLPRDHIAAGVAMAVVAAVAVWLRRFGPRAGGLGQLGFIAYYFALMLDLDLAAMPAALFAAGVGLLCGWGANLIPGPSLQRQIDGAVAAMTERVAFLLETLVDVVSSARADPRRLRTLRRQQRAIQATAATVGGLLDGTDAAAPAPARARDLRVRVFDLQLAADNLVSLLPIAEATGLTMTQRARVAAELLDARSRLDATASAGGSRLDASESPPPGIPTDARRLSAAVLELSEAADRLRVSRATADRPEGLAALAGSSTAGTTAGRIPTGSHGQASTEAVTDADTARASARQGLQAGLSTGLALLLGSFVSTSHQYWAAMPAFSVISGSDGETRLKAAQRIIATLCGAAIAFGLATLADHSPAVAFPLLAVSVFFIAFLRPVASAWASFWQTLLLATMYDVLGTLSVETVQVRIIETAIGALVAVAVSALILPTRTRAKVREAMADLVQQAGVVAHAALTTTAPATDSADNGRSDDQQELTRRLTATESLARPLLSNPGSLRRDGIEAQLTALLSIAYDVRRIAADRADGGAAGLPDAALRRLDLATADNFAAAASVLAGALPRRIHPPEELAANSSPASSDAARTLTLRIIRLNQALLALVDAIKPGTVQAMSAGRSAGQPAVEVASTIQDAAVGREPSARPATAARHDRR